MHIVISKATSKKSTCVCTVHMGSSPGGGMATHSSVPTWRIPWTEEPSGLQSVGSQMDMTEATWHSVTHHTHA